MLMIDFELGIKENSGMDAAGLGDLCKSPSSALLRMLTTSVLSHPG